MKNVRACLFDKITCFILIIAIIITSMPYKVSSTDADVLASGIGIHNNVLTQQSNVETTYNIKLYKTVKTQSGTDENGDHIYTYAYQLIDALPHEFAFSASSPNGTVYLEINGNISLSQGQQVLFNSSADFKDYMIQENITRIVIELQTEAFRDGNQVKVFEQYNSQTNYSGSDAEYDSLNTTTGDPADNTELDKKTEIYKINYITDDNGNTSIINEGGYYVKRYNITPMVDCKANVLWRDINEGRPANDVIQFDISRAEVVNGVTGEYSPYTPGDGITRTVLDLDSNNKLYSYSVPECAENGSVYDYKASERPVDGYYIDKTSQNHFTNFHLTQFSCTVNWKDTAHASDIDKILAVIDDDDHDKETKIQRRTEFIRNNFQLIDETGTEYDALEVTSETLATLSEETQKFIRDNYELDNGVYRLKSENIDYIQDGSDYKIVIKGLQEITTDGTAKVYSLKPKNADSKIPVDEMDGKTDSDGKDIPAYNISENDKSADDSYLISAVNTGVRSNVVDRAYNGATLDLTLIGQTTFSGSLQWFDADNVTARSNAVSGGTAGDFMLYRYVEGKESMVAQVGTWKINQGDSYFYTEDGTDPKPIDKYDNSGAAYFYFAKERLAGDVAGYGIEYVVPDTETHFPFDYSSNGIYNSDKVFPNGAVVKNSLVGSIGFGVDANWIAAELQGGTAEIQYKLQRYNEDTNSWDDIAPVSHTVDGETITEGILDINGFSAEQMEKYGAFYAVDQYDENGHAYKYRVVQTDISRTDNNQIGHYTPDIEMAYDQSGNLVTVSEDGKTYVKLIIDNDEPQKTVTIEINGNKFEVQAVYDPASATFYYEYKLVGEMKLVLDKDWDPVPSHLVEQAWGAQIQLRLKKYNYTTGQFENFEADHGNTGNIQYTDGSADGNGDLIVRTTSDAKGIFTVHRNTFVTEDGTADKFAIKILNAPMYDEKGHLNKYSIEEITDFPGSSPVYSSSKKSDYTEFVANNIFGNGGEEIHFHKVWMDDGEEEYKSDVRIDMSARAMPLPVITGGGQTVSDWETWEGNNWDDVSSNLPAAEVNIPGNWSFLTPWSTNSIFTDPLMNSSNQYALGYVYKNSNNDFPNTFNGLNNGYTYEQISAPSGDTGPLDQNSYPNGVNISAVNSALRFAYNEQKMLNTNHTMNEDNIWTARIQVRIGYSYNNHYNLKDFQEYLTSNKIIAHKFDFRDDDIVETATDKWINMIPAQYNSNSNDGGAQAVCCCY